MDSKSLTRRDAQLLVRDGQINKAIQQYEEAISGGAGAPYDFVYLGDLCIRGERQLEAVGHYEEAIAGYTRLGLHRNSIALWRKILRVPSYLHLPYHVGPGDLRDLILEGRVVLRDAGPMSLGRRS